MKPRKLTEAFVRGLAQPTKPYVVRDTAVTGLMLVVNKTCKSYKVQRDLWVGTRGRRRLVKTVSHTLGTSDDLALDEARTLAMDVIARIKRGEDPNAPQPVDPAQTWTVERLYDEYADDMRRRECADRSIADALGRLDFYLGDWKKLPITQITRRVARDKHVTISTKHGKRVANQALRDFRAAYNLAMRVADDPDSLTDNPTKAITWNKERSSNRVIMPDDLPDWWERLQAVPNPMRRAMHELGLLSGLRPGTLVSLRREWIHLDKRCVSIPRMKSGRSFDLPLSEPMVACIRRALEAGDILYARSEWLFPTRARATGDVIATPTWKEKTLPSETGHILRHTYRTLAKHEGVDQIDARLLLDHTVPGIDGVYIHSRALFGRLLATQEHLSVAILALCKQRDGTGVATKPQGVVRG